MFEGWVKIMRLQMSNQQTMETITILVINVIIKIKSFSGHTLYMDHSGWVNLNKTFGRFSHIYVCFGFDTP